jgi:hypothetical protein
MVVSFLRGTVEAQGYPSLVRARPSWGQSCGEEVFCAKPQMGGKSGVKYARERALMSETTDWKLLGVGYNPAYASFWDIFALLGSLESCVIAWDSLCLC